MIYDKDTNSRFDINDYWSNQVFMADSQHYIDRQSSKEFSTLSRDLDSSNMWDDFWGRKDKANNELIAAVVDGRVGKVRELISPFV